MEGYVLEAVGVSKEFPGVQALNDVTVRTSEHEIHGLIGENGAGKSTLLKIINGIYQKGTFEGSLIMHGKKVELKSPYDALAQGIGYVPQEINVMEDLTVAENIYVGRLNKGKRTVKIKELIKRASAYLVENKFDLNPSSKVSMLSIGQKQLLMIARALSWNPSVLILDEPTTSLAQDDVERLFTIIRNLEDKGTSIIFVTHKLDEIFALTDRVTVLRDGMLVSTFEREDYDRDAIIAAMVGRTITNMYPARSVEIGEEVLRVEDVTVDHPRIQGRTLIRDVSFNVRAGEVLGIAGLVGAGRTETLSAIFGQYPLKTGKVYLDGNLVQIKSESEAIENGVSYVTEDRKEGGLLMLADIKTNIVLSNLKAIRQGLFLSAELENRTSNEYMKRLAVKAPNNKALVANLSGGNQQKVVLAKSLNTNPKVLLLDEPTKGIEVGSKN